MNAVSELVTVSSQPTDNQFHMGAQRCAHTDPGNEANRELLSELAQEIALGPQLSGVYPIFNPQVRDHRGRKSVLSHIQQRISPVCRIWVYPT